jgi:hypothetical protein
MRGFLTQPALPAKRMSERYDFYGILLKGHDSAHPTAPLRNSPTNSLSRSQLRPEGGSPTRLMCNGQGSPRDDVAVVSWYRKAAN